jgi:hypothetical protein
VRSFRVIVHRNERWRIVLAAQEAGRTEMGERENFGKAWDGLRGNRQLEKRLRKALREIGIGIRRKSGGVDDVGPLEIVRPTRSEPR